MRRREKIIISFHIQRVDDLILLVEYESHQDNNSTLYGQGMDFEVGPVTE